MHILTVAQMRELERAADTAGLSYAHMMQRAGTEAAGVILQRMSSNPQPQVLILVGPGNNGGDGLVCARVLHDAGAHVQVYLLKPRALDDPVFAPVCARAIPCVEATSDEHLYALRQLVGPANVIVDALLGTGVSRPIDGLLARVLDVVQAMTQQGVLEHPLIVALDGVTGMNYDTGALDAHALRADLTITFQAPKRGHYCYPAAGVIGELQVVPIGIDELAQPISVSDDHVELADAAWVCAALPKRSSASNKGTHGKVVVIGGCADYSGAPTLTAAAAYRVGAGLVTLGVPRNIQAGAAILCREAIFATLDGTQDVMTPAALPRLADLLSGLDQRHAVVVGPGMGQHSETRKFLFELLVALRQKSGVRLLLDADGLNMVASAPDWPAMLPPNSVLTPHPGEMSRLTGLSISAVQADRIGCALEYAHRWGHTVVLKGAYSVIAPANGTAMVLPFANAALAVAGSGDVLAGCIAGLLAQGLDGYTAAVCGGFLHATAGDRWSAENGDAGLLASDLLHILPQTIQALRQKGTYFDVPGRW